MQASALLSQQPPPQPPLGYYPVPPKQPGMSAGAKIALGIIIGSCVVMGGCFACATFIWENAKRNLNSNSAVSGTGSPSLASSPQPTAAAAPTRTAWQYSDSEDEMTGQKTKMAVVMSSNTFEFAFPYGGEQHATLILRKKRGSDNVILTIEKGQLTCGDYFGRSISVRFDEKPARRFRVTEPADHSSTKVFINSEKSFIAETKKAKRIRIEAIVYQNGSPVFEFNTAGLEW